MTDFDPFLERAGHATHRRRIGPFARLLCALAASMLFIAPIRAATSAPPIDVQTLGAIVTDAAQVDRTRINSAASMASSADPRALVFLFKAITDPATRALVRDALTDTLRLSPQTEAVAEFLAERLTDPHESSDVRASSARVLGAQRLRRNEAVLRGFIKHPDPGIRLAVLQGLLAFDPEKSDRANLLGAILTDREQPGDARSAAARELGASGEPLAGPALANVLHEEMARLPEPTDAGKLLVQANLMNSLVPLAAARALGELGDPKAAADLLTVAGHSEPEMRVAVFESLARLKSAAALTAARHALAEDSNYRVRRWAAVLLKELEEPETIPDLRRALAQDSDPGVRLQVTQALEALQDRESLAMIRAALEREELIEVRAALEQSASALGSPMGQIRGSAEP